MDGSVDGAARPHTLPIAVPTGYDQIDGHSERVGYRSWVLCLSRLVLQRGTIPLRPVSVHVSRREQLQAFVDPTHSMLSSIEAVRAHQARLVRGGPLTQLCSYDP